MQRDILAIAELMEPAFDEFHRASAEEIRHIEALVNTSLPEDYVAFLEKFGGASFPNESSVRGISGKRYSPFVFFAANGSRCAVIPDLLTHSDYRERSLVPIADDLFNNRFVLNLPKGGVWFMGYSHGVVEEPVMPSFEAFMRGLKTVVDGAL